MFFFSSYFFTVRKRLHRSKRSGAQFREVTAVLRKLQKTKERFRTRRAWIVFGDHWHHVAVSIGILNRDNDHLRSVAVVPEASGDCDHLEQRRRRAIQQVQHRIGVAGRVVAGRKMNKHLCGHTTSRTCGQSTRPWAPVRRWDSNADNVVQSRAHPQHFTPNSAGSYASCDASQRSVTSSACPFRRA